MGRFWRMKKLCNILKRLFDVRPTVFYTSRGLRASIHRAFMPLPASFVEVYLASQALCQADAVFGNSRPVALGPSFPDNRLPPQGRKMERTSPASRTF